MRPRAGRQFCETRNSGLGYAHHFSIYKPRFFLAWTAISLAPFTRILPFLPQLPARVSDTQKRERVLMTTPIRGIFVSLSASKICTPLAAARTQLCIVLASCSSPHSISFILITFGALSHFSIYIYPLSPPPVRHHRHPLTTVAALPARETLAECETALVEAETGGPREERRDQSQRSRPRENAEEGGEYRGPGETSLEEAETEA